MLRLDLKLHLTSTWGLTKAFTSLLFFSKNFLFYWYCSWKSQVMQFWPTDFTCQFICWDHKKGAVNRSYGQRAKQRPTLYFTCVEGLSYNLQNFKCKISIDLRMSWKSWSQDCPVDEKKKWINTLTACLCSLNLVDFLNCESAICGNTSGRINYPL